MSVIDAQLDAAEREWLQASATIVAIGQGEPERTAQVARRRGYPPILYDPNRTTYEAFGLLEGTPAQILHDFPWKPGDRATGEQMMTARRGTERTLVDTPWQLPGEFKTVRLGAIAAAQ